MESQPHGASGYLVKLGEPWHNHVTGVSAYVVVPATITLKSHSQTGATFTVALHKLADGWRL